VRDLAGVPGQRQALLAEQRPLRLTAGVPLAVLVDGESGSGSEVLAAAFKEYQLATLIGQKSAGSVGIAQTRQLSDGSAVQITTSKLVTPSGGQLDRVGVQPDETVGLTVADLESGRDPQRDRSVQLLGERLGRS
jgi:carboxyl-terminal processing protease